MKGLLVVAIAAALCSACSSLPPAQTVASSGSAAQVVRSGQGAPAIVLQSGLGDGASPWSSVFDALSRSREVIVIERPGYGGSAASAAARDPCTIATEQHALLQRLDVKPPYLLVGHSLGGRYQWVYAALYPDEVAGLVLVEATHPEHWQRLQRDAPAMATTVLALRFAFTATMKREFDQQDQCLAERIGPAQRERLRRIPTRVLARESYSITERGAFETMHRQSQRDWLALTGAPQLQLVAGSGHYLQRDRPDAVVAAVNDLLRTTAVSANRLSAP
jgi:pimeloyl-ACP methyl ester carboxylesterase